MKELSWEMGKNGFFYKNGLGVDNAIEQTG